MQFLFGPVPSRRYGRSLGVDLSTPKTCTLDCRFCQLGHTPTPTLDRTDTPPIAAVLAELRQWAASGGTADFITASGSGEPTLHRHFADLFRYVRAETPCRALLLTNGTLLTLPEVRRDAALAHVVKLSLHAWDQPSFERIVRPHPALRFDAILDGYRAFRDLFTGVNPNGHRHYRSILMGADGVTETPPFACDTHYHVRATKPGLWAAWYSGLSSAMKLLTEWADAWHADAMRTDRGKPKGVMPSAVAFADDRIGGYGPENDWRLTKSGYDYYDWNPGLTQLYDFMYAMWRMTGKNAYLDPVFLAPMPSTTVTWRSYSGDRSRDDIIRDAGGPYGRYLATGDITVIEKEIGRAHV